MIAWNSLRKQGVSDGQERGSTPPGPFIHHDERRSGSQASGDPGEFPVRKVHAAVVRRPAWAHAYALDVDSALRQPRSNGGAQARTDAADANDCRGARPCYGFRKCCHRRRILQGVNVIERKALRGGVADLLGGRHALELPGEIHAGRKGRYEFLGQRVGDGCCAPDGRAARIRQSRFQHTREDERAEPPLGRAIVQRHP